MALTVLFLDQYLEPSDPDGKLILRKYISLIYKVHVAMLLHGLLWLDVVVSNFKTLRENFVSISF